MKHAPDRIAELFSDGFVGFMFSVVCLAAAEALKRGIEPEVGDVCEPITGERLPAGMEAMIRRYHAAAVPILRAVTPQQREELIALCRRHLLAAGYSAEAGYSH